MRIGGKYNWKGQPERLKYLGKNGVWNQFEKIEAPGVVWCEVLDGDLHMIEETVCHATETLCSTCGNDLRKCVGMTPNTGNSRHP
jgi:hypothetical protein